MEDLAVARLRSSISTSDTLALIGAALQIPKNL